MAQPSLAGYSVLIIDDNDILLHDYEAFLQPTGISVYTAKNGDDGIRLAQTHHPSLILLDLMLPGKNGIEVLEELKDIPAICDIPVIVVTALLEDKERDLCLKAGATDYLEKISIEPYQLIAKIRHTIKQPL